MNKEQDEELDDLFKKGLGDPVDQASYKEEDWTSLERMLKKHRKPKGIVYLLPVLSSAAALLLLFLAWWSLRPKAAHHYSSGHIQAVISQHAKNTGNSGGSTRQPIDHKQNKTLSSNYAENSRVGKVGGKSRSFFPLSSDRTRRDTTGNEQNNTFNRQPDLVLAAVSQKEIFEPVSMISQPVYPVDIPLVAGPVNGLPVTKNDKIKVKPQSTFHPQFAITVLAASDLNGVGSFQQSEVGTNAGLLFSAGVSRKFTITTGAIYSVKPYTTGFGNYHTPYQFPVDPVNVAADCKMLDIPIDFGYQIYNKHQNKISIGTGLSSYIMLQESYKFNYANQVTAGPANFTVPNSDGYYLAVLNLNATYERQLNSKVGISVQPYLKLPLTNIGYSQARLQTTGVAVGLVWNLNTFKKP
jgi:hypothetical protein